MFSLPTTVAILPVLTFLGVATLTHTAQAIAPQVQISSFKPLVVLPATTTPARVQKKEITRVVINTETGVYRVPFYSQFNDISSRTWQKVGCGITDLAMLVDYYVDNAPSVETLLSQGIAVGAYMPNAGWTHQGLIDIAKKYGLDGASYDFSNLSSSAALAQLEKYVQDGPVMVSVHYKFDPKSTIPHLVVIDGITDGTLYYNDPAAKTGQLQISTANFLKAWKKRLIVIRPEGETLSFVGVATPHYSV